ncbi:hypothetical protein [Stenotrophomonas maltophilia]|uniref:hypothetical protein n=1 Tax=Stenotrophomonas maltophilia TaxID=40324 RepID=UPI0013DB55D1|nr:hypothetical protein [Stenotrophomonas maltophilia]
MKLERCAAVKEGESVDRLAEPSEMMTTVWNFPITGDRVGEVLMGAFGADETWLVSHMDVPSGTTSSTILGVLRERMANGPATVSTGNLCDALAGVPQVWVLDVCLSSDKDVQLYIEDGELFEANLVRAQASRGRAASDETVSGSRGRK